MNFKVGDLVTRLSHDNDIVFKIIAIDVNKCYLKGEYVRLYADCNISDLKLYDDIDNEERDFINKISTKMDLREDYFYLPGKILHIDAVYFDN